MRLHDRSLLGSLCAILLLLLAVALPCAAQPPEDGDDDAKLRPLEPDFTIINLPTTLPLPRHAGNFLLTHRFGGDFRKQQFDDLASNLFGLDEGAVISFGYRFGLMKHVEVAAQRTNFDKAVEFQGKYDAFHQSQSRPIGLSTIVSVEGANNFRRDYAQALGVSVSRTIASLAAVYVDPFWVHNSAPSTDVTRNTFLLGLGGRLRITAGAFLVGEVAPRPAGFRPGQTQYAFGIEKRYGGHVFQLNFGNSRGGVTYGELARGGAPSLFMGFNLTRKFY